MATYYFTTDMIMEVRTASIQHNLMIEEFI